MEGASEVEGGVRWRERVRCRNEVEGVQCSRLWGRGAYSQVVHFASEVEEDGRPRIPLEPLLQDVCGLITPYRQQTGVSHM